MRATTTAALSGAAAIGIAATVHAGPVLAGLSPIGTFVAPRLAGCGYGDHVALTFDDGPDSVSTPQFLAALDRLGWRATFFMLGAMARRAPSLVADIAAAGHEIAVHGDEHRNLLWRTPTATRDDITRSRDTIAELSGTTPRWFRPPYGALSLAALRIARNRSLRTVLWTTWGRDWRAESTPDNVAAMVLSRRVAGGTVLLHDSDCTSSPSSWRSALGALPLLAEAFAERGLTCGPLRDHGIDVLGMQRRV